MSLGSLAKHYAVRIAATAVVLLMVALFLGPMLISYLPVAAPLVRWLMGALLLPLVLYLAIKFVGEALGTRSGTAVKGAGHAIARLVAPAVFAYFLLDGTLGLVLALMPPSSAVVLADARRMAAALYVFILGVLVIRYGGDFGYPLRPAVRDIGLAVLLYGIAGLLSPLYAPLGTPLLYASAAAALMSAVAFLGLSESLRPAVSDVTRISGLIVVLFLLVGAVYMLGQIPLLRPYYEYVEAGSMAVLAAAVSMIGYRIYSSYSRVAERMAERIYEQHARESPLVASSDDEEFVEAVDEFARHGRKHALIAYAAYALAHCDLEFAEIRKALEKLIEYEPSSYGGMWPWERGKVVDRATRDAEVRRELVREVVEAISGCGRGSARATGSRASQP